MRVAGVISVVLLVAVVISGCANVSTAETDTSLQRRTLAPGGLLPTPPAPNQRPTLDTWGAQATAWAYATLGAQTAGQVAGAEMTAQAMLDYAESAASNPDAIVATAEAFALMMAMDPAEVDAMINAVLGEVPDSWYADTGTTSDDLEVLMDAWLSRGNIMVQWQGDALVATVEYSETGLNALVDASVALWEYPVEDVNVDLVPDGAVVDIYGFSTVTGVAGDLSLYMLLTVEEGRVTVDLMSASLNGRAVPAAKLDDVETLIMDLSSVWNEVLSVVYGVSYELDELTIRDDTFTAAVTVLGMAQ